VRPFHPNPTASLSLELFNLQSDSGDGRRTSVKPLWIWSSSGLGLRKAYLCMASLTSRSGSRKPHTATLFSLNSSSVSSFARLPRICTYSVLVSTEVFPMCVPIQPVLDDFSLTDTPGSILSTTNTMVQTRRNTTRNKRTGRAPHNNSLYSASFPSVLLLPIHARLLAVLHQLVDNALPHRVVDCLCLPQLLFELGQFHL